ncbi:MAG: hypothetical protein U5K75_12075 [Ahrensia sp.]|nr:hypothetical protein [Ahrensia sp.]
MEKTTLGEFILDYWHFGAWLLAGIIGIAVGKERTRFKVDQVGAELKAQGERIKTLEAQGVKFEVHLAKISVSVDNIVKSVDEVKQTLRSKADK